MNRLFRVGHQEIGLQPEAFSPEGPCSPSPQLQNKICCFPVEAIGGRHSIAAGRAATRRGGSRQSRPLTLRWIAGVIKGLGGWWCSSMMYSRGSVSTEAMPFFSRYSFEPDSRGDHRLAPGDAPTGVVRLTSRCRNRGRSRRADLRHRPRR
jgi:hypothetical protein